MTLRGPETQPRTQNRKLRANSFLANNTFTDELISIFIFAKIKHSKKHFSSNWASLSKIYCSDQNLLPRPIRRKSPFDQNLLWKGKSPPATIPSKIYSPTKIYQKRKISSRAQSATPSKIYSPKGKSTPSQNLQEKKHFKFKFQKLNYSNIVYNCWRTLCDVQTPKFRHTPHQYMYGS